MGLLEELMGAAGVAGGAPVPALDDKHEAMAQAVMGLVAQQGPAGLQSLAQGFDQGGLGNLMASWIGGGPNLPATPAHIQQGLGGDLIAQLAQKVGVSPQVASSLLAVVLPLVINRLTPQGQVPSQGDLGDLLGGLLGGGNTGGDPMGGLGGLLGGLLGGKR
jgi:uncharacterized protein YidB (DUF937 family)